MPNSFTNIGFIGAGNMAQAIGFRLLSEGLLKFSDMIVSAPTDRNLIQWSQKGIKTTNNNFEVVKTAEIVFIAVKPQYFEQAVQSLRSDKYENEFRIFVSVMAGRTIDYIKKTFRTFAQNITNFAVIRVMPNTPCLVGKGCSVLSHGPEVPEDFVEEVKRIMAFTGSCDVIPEHLIDAVSAVCGSGPAYIYIVIESLADGAVRCGVPRDLAIKIASQTVIGAGEMLINFHKHPGQLKDEVCSPGGTTIAAVHELEKAGIRCAFINAVQAATNRSIELSEMKKK